MNLPVAHEMKAIGGHEIQFTGEMLQKALRAPSPRDLTRAARPDPSRRDLTAPGAT